jgi:hypothetical protein
MGTGRSQANEIRIENLKIRDLPDFAALSSVLPEAATPQHYRLAIDVQLSGNCAVGLPLRINQNDRAPKRRLLGCPMCCQALLDLFLFRWAPTQSKSSYGHDSALPNPRPLFGYLLGPKRVITREAPGLRASRLWDLKKGGVSYCNKTPPSCVKKALVRGRNIYPFAE